MAETPLPVVSTQCPHCGAHVPTTIAACPDCGAQRPLLPALSPLPPEPATAPDIAFAVLVGGLAICATFSASFELFQSLLQGPPDLRRALAASVLNWVIWGYPVIAVTRAWYAGTRRGDEDKSYLWRIYLQAQLLTFSMLAVLAVLVAAFGLAVLIANRR